MTEFEGKFVLFMEQNRVIEFILLFSLLLLLLFLTVFWMMIKLIM